MRSLNTARGIAASDKELLLCAKQSVVRQIPRAKVLLYGSVARGTASQDSDYDILVITPRKLTTREEDAVFDGLYRISLDRDVLLSAVIFSREEWEMPLVKASSFRTNVIKDCLLV